MLPQAFPKPISPSARPSKATLPLNITGQTLGSIVPASSPPAGPSKATLPPHTSGQTPGPCAFKGVQACRLPGLKPFKWSQAFPKPISPPAGPSKATLPLNIPGQTLRPSAFEAVCMPTAMAFTMSKLVPASSPPAGPSYGRYLSSAHAGRLYDMGIQALQFYNASAWEALWATPSPSWNWGPVPNIEPTSPTNGGVGGTRALAHSILISIDLRIFYWYTNNHG